MEAGEMEMRQAFEETTTRNVKSAITYSNETRKIVRQLEEKIVHLERLAQGKDKELAEMKLQIARIQQQLYLKGTQ